MERRNKEGTDRAEEGEGERNLGNSLWVWGYLVVIHITLDNRRVNLTTTDHKKSNSITV